MFKVLDQPEKQSGSWLNSIFKNSEIARESMCSKNIINKVSDLGKITGIINKSADDAADDMEKKKRKMLL